MSRNYVVEQLFVFAKKEPQALVAEDAADKLRPLPGLWPEPAPHGLMLLGTSELPLDAAATLLQALHGDHACAGPRRVCYLREPRMQPIMDVFVRAPLVCADGLLEDLRRRGAVVRISTGSPSSWLVRAEAPMASLLGYRRYLAAETGGSADHWITFNRWEPQPQADAKPAQALRVPAGV